MKALVVDDVRANRTLPLMLLRKNGWEVVEAEDGAAALALLMDTQFDLVVMDISMPKMDGDKVCSTIRAGSPNVSTRMIAYTAHALPSEIDGFLRAGFDFVIVKPVTLDRLREALGV